MEFVLIVIWAVVNALVSLLLARQNRMVNERLREGLRQVDENMKLVNTMRAVEAGLITVQQDGSGPETKASCQIWVSVGRN